MAFSSKGDPVKRPVEIIDDIREFSSILLAFFAIVGILLSLTLGSTYMVNTFRRSTMRNKIRKFCGHSSRAFENIIGTALDQENYQPKKTIRRMVWLFLVIAIFVVVFGYYLNLMQTNMVSDVWPPTIDRISDFFTERFKSVEVFMVKSLWFYEVLFNSDPGSDLRILYDRIKASNNCSTSNNRYCGFYKLVFGDFLKMVNLAKYLANFIASRRGSIITSDVSMQVARTGICSFKPSLWRNLHHTQPLASGTVAFFGSVNGDRKFQRFMDILEKMAVIESGLFMKQLTENSLNLFESLFQQSPGLTYYKCTDKVPDDETSEPELKFVALRTFLFVITICLMISSLFLLAETLTSRIYKRQGVNKKILSSDGLTTSKNQVEPLFHRRIAPSPSTTMVVRGENIRTKQLMIHKTNEIKKVIRFSSPLKVSTNQRTSNIANHETTEKLDGAK